MGLFFRWPKFGHEKKDYFALKSDVNFNLVPTFLPQMKVNLDCCLIGQREVWA